MDDLKIKHWAKVAEQTAVLRDLHHKQDRLLSRLAFYANLTIQGVDPADVRGMDRVRDWGEHNLRFVAKHKGKVYRVRLENGEHVEINPLLECPVVEARD